MRQRTDRGETAIGIDEADPEGMMRWGEWYEVEEHRRVAFDELANGVVVSTIFTGIDAHQAWGTGRPRLWETMAFKGGEILVQERFDNRGEAERWKGHMPGHSGEAR